MFCSLQCIKELDKVDCCCSAYLRSQSLLAWGVKPFIRCTFHSCSLLVCPFYCLASIVDVEGSVRYLYEISTREVMLPPFPLFSPLHLLLKSDASSGYGWGDCLLSQEHLAWVSCWVGGLQCQSLHSFSASSAATKNEHHCNSRHSHLRPLSTEQPNPNLRSRCLVKSCVSLAA